MGRQFSLLLPTSECLQGGSREQTAFDWKRSLSAETRCETLHPNALSWAKELLSTLFTPAPGNVLSRAKGTT